MDRAQLVSPRERVLTVPELLDTIFSFLDIQTNSMRNAACVSKLWSSIALDKIWRDVTDISRLFSLLSPLEPLTPGAYHGPRVRFQFSRTPTPDDWGIFLKYSHRVRSLVFDHFFREGESSTLDLTVFDTIARTRTTLDILPNNKSLTWKSDANLLQYCVLFLHPNLSELILHLEPPRLGFPAGIGQEAKLQYYRPLFADILARSPNVTLLDLRTCIPASDLEPIFVKCLPKLSRLQKIVFPQFYITSRLTEALSKLEDLECIEYQYPPMQGHGSPADIRTFEPVLQEGAFPFLYDLSLTTSFHNFARFIETPFAPEKLTLIFVESFQVEQPADFEYLITTIVDNAPLVEQLCILSEVDASGETVAPPGVGESITLSHIQGIVSLPHLRHFEMHHQFPVQFSHQDIEQLARQLSDRIEVLILNCEPAYIETSSLTLAELVPFAKHCPKLVHLALFVDASASLSSFSLDQLVLDPPPRFEALHRFWAGTSLIANDSEGAVALFLSHLFPSGCVLDAGITWSSSSSSMMVDDASGSAMGGVNGGRVLSIQMWDAIQQRCQRWVRVRELLPLLIQLRGEEQEKTRVLRAEVEDLRMRTDVLIAEKRAGRRRRQEGCVLF